MKNFFIILTLFFISHNLFSQKTEGISLDDEPTFVDTGGYVNVDSLQSYNKELITGSYILADNAWFTDEHFTMLEKINYLKEHKNSFQYFYFVRNGKILEETNIAEKDVKFVKDVSFNYGSWFIDKDQLNIVMSGFSINHGKFEYRIVYSFKKVNKDIELTIVQKKLVTEDMPDH